MALKQSHPTPVEHKTATDPQTKQVYWIIGTLVGLLIVFLLFYSFFQSLNTFTYEGLSFTKTRYESIPVYHYYYYFDDSRGNQYRYNLYLRNDPRKNNIPVSGTILYNTNKFVYISANDTAFAHCPQSNLALYGLTSFLTNNLLQVRPGVPNEAQAVALNRSYVTCETDPANTVILLQPGNQTSIVSHDLCTTITIADCEIMQAVEKFQVASILDAKRGAALQ